LRGNIENETAAGSGSRPGARGSCPAPGRHRRSRPNPPWPPGPGGELAPFGTAPASDLSGRDLRETARSTRRWPGCPCRSRARPPETMLMFVQSPPAMRCMMVRHGTPAAPPIQTRRRRHAPALLSARCVILESARPRLLTTLACTLTARKKIVAGMPCNARRPAFRPSSTLPLRVCRDGDALQTHRRCTPGFHASSARSPRSQSMWASSAPRPSAP